MIYLLQNAESFFLGIHPINNSKILSIRISNHSNIRRPVNPRSKKLCTSPKVVSKNVSACWTKKWPCQQSWPRTVRSQISFETFCSTSRNRSFLSADRWDRSHWSTRQIRPLKIIQTINYIIQSAIDRVEIRTGLDFWSGCVVQSEGLAN